MKSAMLVVITSVLQHAMAKSQSIHDAQATLVIAFRLMRSDVPVAGFAKIGIDYWQQGPRPDIELALQMRTAKLYHRYPTARTIRARARIFCCAYF